MVPSVLIVDDEKHTREGLQQALAEAYDVSVAANADEAFNLMDAQPFDVILTDLRMPGKSGLKVIDKALSLANRPAVLMMTAYGNVESAVEAMKRGAVDFLTKPVNIERLEVLIQRALKTKTLEVEVKHLHERLDEKFSFEGIIGNSPRLKEVIDRVKLVAPSRATILIDGESGTGKELIAQAIHQSSPRSRGPFVAVHCAALSESLLESELFGHERGSFTGATERRIGRFESADGGTLFLDEIGEISPSTQVKLLRFLETKSVERVAWSPRRIAISSCRCAKENSARICSSGLTSCASRCRHSATVRKMCRCCSRTISRFSPTRMVFRRSRWSPARFTHCRIIRGPEMCASCAISARTRSCCGAAAVSANTIWSPSIAA
jgi:two-component system response regulator AtoC